MNEKISDKDSSSPESKESYYIQEKGPFVPSEAEKRLVKKMSRIFIPYACLIQFIQMVDKTSLSSVSVLPQFFIDTGIGKDQFAWLGSVFYFGFLCMQLPNNYALQKFPLSKYTGVILVLWGLSLFCMAFANSFIQLAILRFLLGFFEAISYPTIILLISTLYRRSEQVQWIGAIFMSNGVATVIGAVASVGIMQLPTVGQFSPWKWNVILFGSITILMGLVYFFFLPDTPTSRWFHLTEEEKAIIEQRTRDNAVVPTMKVNYGHIWEALREPRFYCYCLISMLLCLQNGALTIFSAMIIADLGFSSTHAILLNIPSGITSMLIVFVATTVSKRKNEIILVAMCACTLSLIGLTCLTVIPTGGVKLIGLYLSWSSTATFVLMTTSISNNVSGYTKKIFFTSGHLIFYTVGNFVGPLLLREKDAPRYLMGMGVYMAANIVVILLSAYIRYTYVRRNKKRNLDKYINGTVVLPDGLQDWTDVQNDHFVYRT